MGSISGSKAKMISDPSLKKPNGPNSKKGPNLNPIEEKKLKDLGKQDDEMKKTSGVGSPPETPLKNVGAFHKMPDEIKEKENAKKEIRSAIISGNTSQVEKLLDSGLVKVNDKIDMMQNTMLHLAVSSGKEEIVELLLKKGADCSLKNFGVNYKMTTKINEFGQNVSVQVKVEDRKSPLLWAANNNNLKIGKLFFNKIKEDPAALKKIFEGETERKNVDVILDFAMRCDKSTSTPDVTKETKTVIENKPTKSPNVTKKMTQAIEENNSKEVLNLIQDNPGVINEVIDEEKNTLLSFAIAEGKTEIAIHLLDNGADVSLKNIDGESPLHFAANTENVELGKRIIIKMKENGVTLDSLIKEDNEETAELISNFVSSCQTKSADPDVTNKIMNAIEENNSEEVLSLIHNNPDAINEPIDEDKNTLLAFAIAEGKTEIAIILIENGADVSLENIDGESPLDLAEEYRNKEIMKYISDMEKD